MKKDKLLLGIFTAVSILYIIGVTLDNLTMRFLFKPFIILSLIQYYISSVSKKNNILIAAFFLCFLGDMAMLYDVNDKAFMLGLVFFLLAHVLFIIVVARTLEGIKIGQILVSIIPFGLLFYGLISVLYDDLGEMLNPILVYGVVISILGSMAVMNYLINKSSSSIMLTGGVISFILSDFSIALNKFSLPHEYFPILISITYIIAQFLICKFMIFDDDERENPISVHI